MNRSIQVEGAFGVLKQDYGFGRFLTRGKTNNETRRTHYHRDRALDDIKQGKHKLHSSAAPDVHDGAALLPPVSRVITSLMFALYRVFYEKAPHVPSSGSCERPLPKNDPQNFC